MASKLTIRVAAWLLRCAGLRATFEVREKRVGPNTRESTPGRRIYSGGLTGAVVALAKARSTRWHKRFTLQFVATIIRHDPYPAITPLQSPAPDIPKPLTVNRDKVLDLLPEGEELDHECNDKGPMRMLDGESFEPTCMTCGRGARSGLLPLGRPEEAESA